MLLLEMQLLGGWHGGGEEGVWSVTVVPKGCHHVALAEASSASVCCVAMIYHFCATLDCQHEGFASISPTPGNLVSQSLYMGIPGTTISITQRSCMCDHVNLQPNQPPSPPWGQFGTFVCCARLQQGGSIIASGNISTADDDASLLLQASSCWWQLGSNGPPGSKYLVSRPHQERLSPTWAIPTMHSLPTAQIYELPSAANWRP